MLTYKKILSAVVLAQMASFSVDAYAQAARPVGVSDEQLYGTVIRKSKWETLSIPVCWENLSRSDAPYRAITRDAVEETWERHSDVRFTGWGACTKDSKGIHIRVADEGPHVKALGKYLDQRPGGMVLNFTFNTWGAGTLCAIDRNFCVYALAVHEFGHALGFAHEQTHEDKPAECKADSAGPAGDYHVTKYDPASVMNYCNPEWIGDGKLSELDIEAVRKFYGSP